MDMVLVDGKKIASNVAEQVFVEIKENKFSPKMVVITCDPNFETKKYLSLKQSKAEALGIELEIIILSSESDTKTVIETIKNKSSEVDGIIVQLPLPKHIDTKIILQAIPKELDVDVFSYNGDDLNILPPVIGAIDEISNFHQVAWKDKKVVIFGSGRLVGAPAEKYAHEKGSQVVVLNKESKDSKEFILNADIVILGVGKPNLLTPEMVKDDVVVFDAGASEDGGLLVGDASPLVAEKAKLFTPVPGGIGPITIAVLFRNLVELKKRQ